MALYTYALGNRSSVNCSLEILCSALRGAIRQRRRRDYKFRLVDAFGKRRVSKKEFMQGCSVLGLAVSEQDMQLVWSYLADGQEDGSIIVADLEAYAKARGPPPKSQLKDNSWITYKAGDRMLVDETTGIERKERIRLKTEYTEKLHTLSHALRRSVQQYCKHYQTTPQKLFSKLRKGRDLHELTSRRSELKPRLLK